MAAGLVGPERRGLVSGTLLSGSTAGMLLSRTLGGALAEWLGVRAYDAAGWTGVCALVAALTTLALTRHVVALRRSEVNPRGQ
ncbi:hypothetical protein [Nonomuraea maritima]|uniref:hypothetical protein n=1 Tax=Nonomuraea maritima TaxID=683260 RepID=UPI00371B1EC4